MKILNSAFTKLDMHMHSEYSADSKLSLDKISGFLDKNTEFGIVLSDHNEIAGALKLQERYPDRVIAGEEIKTDSGEVTGFFLKEKIAPFKSITWTIDAIIAQGGLVYIPHPKDRLRTSKLTPEGLQTAVKRADIIEIFNSRNVFAADDRKALELAAENGLLMGCGSDAHTLWELGNSYMVFDSSFEMTPDGFLEALKDAKPHTKRTFQGIHVITKIDKIKKKHFGK